MSILDTFYILFKTDADKAAAEVKEVGRAGDIAERGLLKADAAAARLGGSFVGLAQSLAAPLIALASVGGLVSAAMNRITAIDDISDAASKLRSTTEEYESFTRAVRASGGTLQDAQDNLANFSDKLNDAAARPDGPNAKNFAKWGIAFKDVNGEAVGAVEGILSLAKSLENVSKAEALGRLRRLGIRDADTISFLLDGKKAIEDKMEAEKKAGIVTEEQIAIVGDYQSALGKSENLLDTFSNKLVGALVPALTAGLNAFSRTFGWLLNHETLVKGFFIGVAAVITATYLPAISAAAAATIAATWPFLAIGAAVAAAGAAFALAYEDVVAFLNGQPSLIGELVKKYQWLADAVVEVWERIKSAARVAADVISSIVSGYIKMYQPLIDAFKNAFRLVEEVAAAFRARLLADFGPLVEAWKSRFDEIRQSVTSSFNGMYDDAAPIVEKIGALATVIKDLFVTAFNIVKSVWEGTIGAIASGINSTVEKIRGMLNLSAITPGPDYTPPGQLGAAGASPANTPGATIGAMYMKNAAATPLNGQTSASINNAANTNVQQTNTVNVGAVNIETQATDAKGISDAVGTALDNRLKQSLNHFDDGVDR